MKNRFIGGVVTPAQPQYLYGMVDDRADAHDFQESPPILGIAAAVGGYKVHPLAQVMHVSVIQGSNIPRPYSWLVLCLCLCVRLLQLIGVAFVQRLLGFASPRPAQSLMLCTAPLPCLPCASQSKSAQIIFVTTSLLLES